jgi:hypothetical protein
LGAGGVTSAIRPFAVAHAKDADGFIILIKTNTIIADAEAVLGPVDALQLPHIASGVLRKAINGLR